MGTMDDADRFCDLHAHSRASDGSDTPEALASHAASLGLAALALTDHDTTAGVALCAKACRRLGLAFIPGIELSADPGSVVPGAEMGEPGVDRLPDTPRGTLHLLGYFIDPDDATLRQIHHEMLDARSQRNPRIIEKLNELGVRIVYDDVLEVAAASGTEVIGRPHIAQVLVNRGYAKSIQDAFSRYIGQGRPAYARKDLLSAERAIAAIHGAGGVAVLAHPVQVGLDEVGELDRYVWRLRDLGLDGLEVKHPDHTAGDVAHFRALAEDLALIPTGGSDYHGSRKALELGAMRVPAEWVDRLRERAGGG
jgi:hypothetical protein